MQTNKENIIETTEDELYDWYFNSDMDEVIDFNEYKKQMKKIGYRIRGQEYV